MGDWNLSDLGEQIESYVHNAVNKMDFDKLNTNISNTINDALEEVQEKLQQSTNRREHRYHYSSQREHSERDGESIRSGERLTSADLERERLNRAKERNKMRERMRQNPRAGVEYVRQNVRSQIQTAGKNSIAKSNGGLLVRNTTWDSISGAAQVALGSVFGGISALALLINTIVLSTGAFYGYNMSVFYGIFIPCFVIFSLIDINGIRRLGRVKRFKQYVKVIRGRSYCTIKELSLGTGRSEKYVSKDLKRMIRDRMFLEGTIDDENTCIMMNYEVYEQYRIAQKNLEERQKEERENNLKQKASEEASMENALDQEIRNTIGAGRDCIEQIRIANDNIPGKEISEKLYRLESVVSKIFDHVEKHPEQISDIRKFMEYYLPTTLKLVTTYEKLDNQSIESVNISSAKQEIEKTLDTINEAFENLFDSLFANVAMDISTDITVLKSILEQEGLTGGGFAKKSKAMEEDNGN